MDLHTTGLVGSERYRVAQDRGEIIKPQIVDGQIRGELALATLAVWTFEQHPPPGMICELPNLTR